MVGALVPFDSNTKLLATEKKICEMRKVPHCKAVENLLLYASPRPDITFAVYNSVCPYMQNPGKGH